jgi:hypothetical protein
VNELPERGSERYLEHVEAAFALAYTTLALIVAADTTDQAEQVAERAVGVINDLSPLVAAIFRHVESTATLESMADELARLEAHGLTRAAVRVRYRLEQLRRRRAGETGP